MAQRKDCTFLSSVEISKMGNPMIINCIILEITGIKKRKEDCQWKECRGHEEKEAAVVQVSKPVWNSRHKDSAPVQPLYILRILRSQ